jgi:hypothetical protein
MIGAYLVFSADRPIAHGVAPTALPASMWVLTGHYLVGGRSWDMSEEGLYSIFDPATGIATNRIAMKNWTGGADLYKALSGVCWNHVHGSDHNGLDFQAMSNIGRNRKWSAQCGQIAGMLAWLLPQCGFTARTRNAVTLLPKNGVDDGHVVLETLHNGQWRMWDITCGCWWRDATGKHLSTADLVTHVNAGGPLPERVELCPLRQADSDAAGGIDIQIYNWFMLRTPEQRDAWVRRIFQSVLP